VHPKPWPWIRYLLDYLYAGGCGFAAVQLAETGHLPPSLSFSRGAAIVLMWIAAIYFWQRGFRHAMRLQVERRFRFEAEKAPIHLGLNKDPFSNQERNDEDES
jgi:hypothetical protein